MFLTQTAAFAGIIVASQLPAINAGMETGAPSHFSGIPLSSNVLSKPEWL
jgi:hypothetical protein